MPDSSLSNAIDDWIEALGDSAIQHTNADLDAYSSSTCGSERQIVAVLKPTSREQVERVVAIANQHAVPLYPISCGKQWGMGSRLPVQDGAAIVDLSGMNRIIEVNAAFHYAVVEPGVTQRQLLDYIEQHDLPLMLNVTGSTSTTSLIGNAMDRGVGYFESRAEGISNLEVVLGKGETIQTGFGHYPQAKTKNLYPHGIGPSLDGLFIQGNFGIVTSACIDLMPKPVDHMAAIIKIDSEEKLSRLVEALVELRQRQIITTVAHIGNRERSYMTLAPLLYDQLIQDGEPKGNASREKAVQWLEAGGFGPWSASVGILGDRAQLKLAKRAIKKAVGGFSKTMFLNNLLVEKARKLSAALRFIPYMRRQQLMLNAIEPIFSLTYGAASDESIKSIFWAAKDYEALDQPDPDQSNSGVLFCLPIVPADGPSVREVVDQTCATFSEYGFNAAITINLVNSKSFEGVISLSFNRQDPKGVEKAHACIKEMETWYMEQGYPPYRVGINSMDQVIHETDPFWTTVRDLKKALDPNGIIAPGRYNLI